MTQKIETCVSKTCLNTHSKVVKVVGPVLQLLIGAAFKYQSVQCNINTATLLIQPLQAKIHVYLQIQNKHRHIIGFTNFVIKKNQCNYQRSICLLLNNYILLFKLRKRNYIFHLSKHENIKPSTIHVIHGHFSSDKISSNLTPCCWMQYL